MEKISRKRCNAEIDALDVFPGKICINCHAKAFDAEVARTGNLPRPNFTQLYKKSP